MYVFIYFLCLCYIFLKLFPGCQVVDDCAPCTNEGCFFVKLTNGEICLESVDGVVGVVAVIQPYFSEMCDAVFPSSTSSSSTSSSTTITFSTSVTTTTKTTSAAPTGDDKGMEWYWIVLIIIFSFTLFLFVGFVLYRQANLKYNRHHDQLNLNDIL